LKRKELNAILQRKKRIVKRQKKSNPEITHELWIDKNLYPTLRWPVEIDHPNDSKAFTLQSDQSKKVLRDIMPQDKIKELGSLQALQRSH
jgi:hypothetical protein